MATQLAEKQGSPDLMGVLQTLLGQKTTTNTSSSANTAPLQQVFNNAMQPMDQQLYNNLIASIFNTSAQQIPELTAALANATGTRTSGNSPLALALNEQNNRAGQQAAQSILTYNQNQQQTAGNAAAQIAGATKGTTQTQKQGTAANTPALALGGFLLNQADKRGLVDKGMKAVSGMFGGGGNATDYISNSPLTNFGSEWDMAPSSYLAPEVASSFDMPVGSSEGSSDWSLGGVGDALGDWGSGVVDAGSDFLGDVGNTVGGWWDDISGFFGFADGGRIGRQVGGWNSPVLSPVFPGRTFWQAESQVRPNSYADGGTIRNRNYMGGPLQRYGMNAVDAAAMQGPQGAPAGLDSIAGNGGINSDMLRQLMTRAMQQADMTGGQGGIEVAPNMTTPGSAINNAMGDPLGQSIMNSVIGNVLGMGLSSATQNPMALQAASLGGKAMGVPIGGVFGVLAAMAQAGMAGQGATNAINQAQDPLAAMMIGIESSRPGYIGDLSGATNSDSLAAAANAVSAINGLDPLDALMGVTNAFGTGTNPSGVGDFGGGGFNTGGVDLGSMDDSWGVDTNPGATDSGSDPGGSNDGTGAESGPGEAGNSAGSGEGDTTAADGGMIHGPGTGTSDTIRAKNRIPGGRNARFSDGEFIIPADSVKVLGEDFLNRLLQATHTPVNR